MSSNVSKSGFRNQEKFFLRNLEPWALKSGNQLKESGIPLTVGIQNPNSTKSGIQYLESRVHSSLTWGDTCTCHMIMLLRHVSFKNCGVCNRELWIFRIFQTLTVKRRPKQLQKFHTMKEFTIALVSITRFGLLENGLFVTKYVSCIFKWVKTRYIQNSILGFCLFICCCCCFGLMQ